MLLPTELMDEECKLIAGAFSISLSFSASFGGVIKSVDYLVLRDYCKKYGLDGIEVFSICKEMLGAMEV